MLQKSDCRGETAIIEAAIIMPLITLAVLALIALSVYSCDRTENEALCEKYAAIASSPEAFAESRTPDSYAAKAASMWNRDKNPYALTDYNEIFDILKSELENDVREKSIVKNCNYSVSIDRELKLTGEYVRVSIKTEYGKGYFAKLFPSASVSAVYRISDNAELIRNLDLINDAIDTAADYIKNSKTFSDTFKGLFGTK